MRTRFVLAALTFVLWSGTATAAKELAVPGMAAGQEGAMTRFLGRCVQVIDKEQMLVSVRDTRSGQYAVLWLKGCITTDVTDGQTWRHAEWGRVTGFGAYKVTGTKTYNSVDGATSTVFVLEPVFE